MSNRGSPQVSVVLPCRDEQDAIASCIKTIQAVFRKHKINGEIIVSDSSSDKSPQIARSLGATVIKHDKEGYGIACRIGLNAAKGRYLFLADADGSYDFNELPKFIDALKSGADMVLGDRFRGGVRKEAMPWTHKYLGNPVLSFLLRLFFGTSVRDVHCGMRAITRESYARLSLHTTGMEFASEMIIQAVKKKLKIAQIPITLHTRKGTSKLRSWSDGWRHLRFMLLYSPLFLFFIPGLVLFLLGSISMAFLYVGEVSILGIPLFYHPMFISSALIITGYMLIIFSLFAKTYAAAHLGDKDPAINPLLQRITLEKTVLMGLGLIAISMIIYSSILVKWIASDFGQLQQIENSIVALTLLVLGIQTIFSAFMGSILNIKESE